MSQGTLSRADHAAPDDGGAIIVKPQNGIGVAAEQQRVQAEIQSRLMVAKSCPRDEVDAVDRIKNSCQRLGVAEAAEYSYSRGGTEITGPTIDLLTLVANHWGNIDYGFRVIQSGQQEDTVECFAWDLESNAKKTVVVTIPRKRFTRNGSTPLTDPRDIYENIANNAQRRVRHCLEAIVPPDVVEDAVRQCRETLQSQADVTPDSIKKLTEAFGKLSVTKEQIEKRIQRRLDTMQPAQLISLRRIYKSIQDGMSKPGDWFEVAEAEAAPKTAADAAKDALRTRKEMVQPPAPIDAGERPQTSEDPDPIFLEEARDVAGMLQAEDRIQPYLDEYLGKAQVEAERTAINGYANEARKRLSGGKKQKQLA